MRRKNIYPTALCIIITYCIPYPGIYLFEIGNRPPPPPLPTYNLKDYARLLQIEPWKQRIFEPLKIKLLYENLCSKISKLADGNEVTVPY